MTTEKFDITKVKPAEDRIIHIPLSLIFADYEWNARSAGFIKASPSGGPDEDKGSDGLKESIRMRGQDTAVQVRPNPAALGKDGAFKRGEPPFLLVTGFTRFAKITDLAAEETGWSDKAHNVPAGCIRAYYMPDMTEQQARGLNLRENVARNNLSVPDTAFAVAAYIGDSKTVTDKMVADELGKSQNHISMLTRIVAGGEHEKQKLFGLTPKVLRAWRDNARVPTTDMIRISATEKGEQLAAFEEVLKKLAAKPKTGGRGVWMPAAKAKIENVGTLLGVLERESCIRVAGVIDWDRAIDHCGPKLDKVPQKGTSDKGPASAKDRAELSTAMKAAYEASVKVPEKKADKPNGDAAVTPAN